MFAVFTTGGSLDLNMGVEVKGEVKYVKFIPAVLYGSKGESLFSTNDADLIDAMKKHHYYGVYYTVKEEINDECPENKACDTEKSIKTIEDELRDPETAVYDETVTTKGMAVAYIQGNYDDVFTATTVEEMKREAARKWNVIFKNWGK